MRAYSTQTDDSEMLTEQDFHKKADATLHDIEEALDELEDTVPDVEYSYSQGELSISLYPHGSWTIKEAPNHELWWSSPISGPKRFEYDSKNLWWCCTRDKEQELLHLLDKEVAELYGTSILQ
mmetsp:Transcript_5655/g.8559  ORF Transcript_5655/g.8559 Transcript_5655/m.8559 type:complete len:123 (-) Transcript_5655:48-416(-)